MKATWIATPLFLAALAACNSGTVNVSPDSPAGPAPAPQGASPGTVSGGDASAGTEATVYFSEVLQLDWAPQSVIGTGFLSSGSTTTRAFGFHFKRALAFGGSPLLDWSRRGAVEFEPSADRGGQIVLLSTETMGRTVLADHVDARAIAASLDGKSAAWVDAGGKAHLLLAGSQARIVSPADWKVTSLRFDTELGTLSVSNGTQTLLLPLAGTAEPVTVEGTGLVTSPDGVRSAFIRSHDGKTYLSFRDARSGKISDLKSVASASDVAWRAPNELSYRTTLTSGAQEIRLVSLETGTESTVAPLSLTSAESTGIVCPAWFRDALYFADTDGSGFSIYRARPASEDSGRWTVEIFAAPRDSSTGFVCPRVSKESL